MKAVEMMTKEEIVNFRLYKKKVRNPLLGEITQEEKSAQTKYNRLVEELNPITYLYHRAKHQAKTRGIVWDLTIDDFVEKVNEVKICPILGLELVYERNHKGGFRSNGEPCRASIDRIDSSLPYTKDNIQIISWRANSMKNNRTEEEFAREILAAVEWAKQKLEVTNVA